MSDRASILRGKQQETAKDEDELVYATQITDELLGQFEAVYPTTTVGKRAQVYCVDRTVMTTGQESVRIINLLQSRLKADGWSLHDLSIGLSWEGIDRAYGWIFSWRTY